MMSFVISMYHIRYRLVFSPTFTFQMHSFQHKNYQLTEYKTNSTENSLLQNWYRIMVVVQHSVHEQIYMSVGRLLQYISSYRTEELTSSCDLL
jgi:hypothetical protein